MILPSVFGSKIRMTEGVLPAISPAFLVCGSTPILCEFFQFAKFVVGTVFASTLGLV